MVNSEGKRVAAKTRRQKGAQRKAIRVNGEWSIVNNFFAGFAFFAPLRETSLILYSSPYCRLPVVQTNPSI
jgi:hypothetical protein